MLQYDFHKGIQTLLKDLNALYINEPALHLKQFDWTGFEWIDHSDHKNSVYVYVRHSEKPMDDIIVVCNMTPIPLKNYRIGIPHKGKLKEIFNSDSKQYNGTGDFTNKPFASQKEPQHFRDFSADITIPPLGMVAFKYTEIAKAVAPKKKAKAVPKKVAKSKPKATTKSTEKADKDAVGKKPKARPKKIDKKTAIPKEKPDSKKAVKAKPKAAEKKVKSKRT